MHFSFKLAVIAGLASLSVSASAGQFSCIAYGDVGCAEHIQDIVTDKFATKYPSKKYAIVTVYDFQQYSDGGGVGFAIVGVVPKKPKSEKNSELSYMPIRRWTVTQRNTGNSLSAGEITKIKIDILRDAVAHMMESCSNDVDCNIMHHQ